MNDEVRQVEHGPDPKAFIVLGLESSGTRLMTRILIKNGCQGEDTHVQRWDTDRIEGDPIVWRRSVPHAGRYFNLSEMLARLSDYEVHIVIMNRDWHCVEMSKNTAKHPETDTMKNYRYMMDTVLAFDVPFTVVSYESLFSGGPMAQRMLFERLGLDWLRYVTVFNENEKHWRATR
jgi:hypothetical protein